MRGLAALVAMDVARIVNAHSVLVFARPTKDDSRCPGPSRSASPVRSASRRINGHHHVQAGPHSDWHLLGHRAHERCRSGLGHGTRVRCAARRFMCVLRTLRWHEQALVAPGYWLPLAP